MDGVPAPFGAAEPMKQICLEQQSCAMVGRCNHRSSFLAHPLDEVVKEAPLLHELAVAGQSSFSLGHRNERMGWLRMLGSAADCSVAMRMAPAV